MNRKSMMLRNFFLTAAARAVLVCLLTRPGSRLLRQVGAGAHDSASVAAARETKAPLLTPAGSAGASGPVADCLSIPVKIKSVKAAAVPGGAPASSVTVEWEVGSSLTNLIIDGFSVAADMRPSGLKAQTTVAGAARSAILKFSGKDDGGTCSVVVTAKGHANLTGSQQIEGRFWTK